MLQPGQPLHQASREAFLDQTVAEISEAVAREYQRWGKTGNHAQRIALIKSFMSARADWITANIGSYAACSNVTVPQLTITRIMYHPEVTTQFPYDDESEFLEIRNTGTTTVNLSGVYFPGTDIIYQFPPGATLAPGLCVILASNATIFQARYGFAPFGQFTRHLSNSGERLILADAFGNVIDYVEYSDQSPWPSADGNGYHLRLAAANLDNSLPGSWIASNEVITSVAAPYAGTEFNIYPNPVRDIVYIDAEDEISSVSLYDIRGSLLRSDIKEGTRCSIDISDLTRGVYIVRIFTARGSNAKKIVKE